MRSSHEAQIDTASPWNRALLLFTDIYKEAATTTMKKERRKRGQYPVWDERTFWTLYRICQNNEKKKINHGESWGPKSS